MRNCSRSKLWVRSCSVTFTEINGPRTQINLGMFRHQWIGRSLFSLHKKELELHKLSFRNCSRSKLRVRSCSVTYTPINGPRSQINLGMFWHQWIGLSKFSLHKKELEPHKLSFRNCSRSKLWVRSCSGSFTAINWPRSQINLGMFRHQCIVLSKFSSHKKELEPHKLSMRNCSRSNLWVRSCSVMSMIFHE